MVGYYNQGVPTSADLENNSNQKKYTVNRQTGKGISISKPLCFLMAIGALLLAVLAGLVVFFLVPRQCNGDKAPEAITQMETRSDSNSVAVPVREVVMDERLPRSLEPLHYRLRIIPDLTNSTFYGEVRIALKAVENTNSIILNLKNLKIDEHSTSVRSQDAPIGVSGQEYLQGERYKVTLTKPLNTDEEYYLDMKFVAELNGHLQGFYKSQYTDNNGREKFILSTQFSPTDARRVFPCFDEPSFKAKFNLTIARPANMSTLANMPLSNITVFPGRKDWFWDHYPETPKMSTYLVAFMVIDLVHSTAKEIKVWSRPHYLHQTAYAAELAPKVLHYFEKYFDIKFPLPKIDIVAVPEFGFSAMENWGLITFRESSLLFDPDTSTNDDKRTIATVLSHELAHQWFGNLVTPKWWNDLWLKEGFATYLEYLGVNEAEPTWKIIDEFILSETQRAMEIDALQSARAISFEVKNSQQIRQTFDVISYAKGACIIRMMNHFLGETAFKNGLINYLKKYQNGNADRQDLFRSLTEEAQKVGTLLPNETVKEIMDTWTERPGFPVVHAVADYSKKTLTIMQRRFYLNGKDEKSSWWVPLSFTSDVILNFNDTRPKFWLRGQQEINTRADFDRWYLLNIDSTGYFIVNYDEKNWHHLTDEIMNLPPLIRAQLISDSMDLARANLLPYDIPLKMIAKMAVQDSTIMIVPTIIAFSKLEFLSDILLDTAAFGLFEQYHKAIFLKTYEKVTFGDPIDDYITRRIRSSVLKWSCRNPNTRCSHESQTAFRQWMIKGTSVAPNLRDIVYCTAIREGGESEWDFAFKKYLESQSPSEKNILLDALGCTKQKWLLSRYVEKLMGNSIQIQDADRVFHSVAKNELGNQIAFDFLRKNWNTLLNRYGDGFNILAKMVKSLARHMNTEFQLSELVKFRDSIKGNVSTTAKAFDSAIEIVKSNVKWLEKNYNQVKDWLNTHRNHFEYDYFL